MLLTKQTLETLADAGWKYTSWMANELGRRDEVYLSSIERSRPSPGFKTACKAVAAAAGVFAGLYYSPALFASTFLALSAYKDIYVSLKRQRLINGVREAKERLFLVHETMGNVRSQSVVLITSTRSQIGPVTAKLIKQWNLFCHLIQTFSCVCSFELKDELYKEESSVITALKALSKAAKGKKSQKQLDACLKTAHKALKSLTEPQEPRGILTKIYISADLAVSRAQEALKAYLAPSF